MYVHHVFEGGRWLQVQAWETGIFEVDRDVFSRRLRLMDKQHGGIQ